MDRLTLIDRVQAMKYGVRLGDTLGLSAENMTAVQILINTFGFGIKTFEDPSKWRVNEDPAFGTSKDKKKGATSDDTQHTAAVDQVFIDCQDYDQEVMARYFALAWMESDYGWGGTTRDGVMEVMRFILSRGKQGRHWNTPAPHRPKRGTGNGVSVRVSGFAAFFLVRDGWGDLDALGPLIMRHGAMTHSDPRASIAAGCIAITLANILYRSASGVPYTKDDPYVQIVRLISWCRKMERLYPHEGETLSSRFEKIFDECLLESADKLREGIGCACIVTQCVPFSIGTFIRHAQDFRAGVLEAVNAGGDADSTASMVGSMIGANVGLADIPEEWRNFRPEYASCMTMGQALVEAAESARDKKRTKT